MDKRKPHYDLSRIKALILQGDYRVTQTAMDCAIRDFDFGEEEEVAKCVLGLHSGDFYKSMTTYRDPRLWQDVYHPAIGKTRAYVKLQIDKDEDAVVISFKNLEDV